jgi:hypothetical protein
MEYVALALGGRGRIIVGDCPVQSSRWAQIVALCHLDEIAATVRRRHPGVTIESRDYRLGRASTIAGVVVRRIVDESNIAEFQHVELGVRSLLIPLMDGKSEFGVSQYPRSRMRTAHTPTTNRYLFPRDVVAADVVINLPKMKSHMKAGITCALKNLVGINGHKDYLPHFRFGSPRTGGDEVPDGDRLWNLEWWLAHQDWDRDGGWQKLAFYAATKGVRIASRWLGAPPYRSWLGGGSWHGNDTLWRTVLDINRAFFYLDRTTGLVLDAPAPVRYLAILDGLVGGEKESPLAPSPVPSGCVLASLNPLAMDSAAAALMGFRHDRLRVLTEGFALSDLPLASFAHDDVQILSSEGSVALRTIFERRCYTPFQPSQGWRGYLEW